MGEGAGIVVAQDGKFRGGDAGLYYIGTYEMSGSDMTAVLSTGRHFGHGQIQSVFGEDEVTVNLTGVYNGNIANLKGSHGPIKFTVTLTFIAD